MAFQRDRLVAELKPASIWLFGSRARGDARPDSDFDPLVVLRDGLPVENSHYAVARPVVACGLGCDIVPASWSTFVGEKDVKGSFVNAIVSEGREVYRARASRKSLVSSTRSTITDGTARPRRNRNNLCSGIPPSLLLPTTTRAGGASRLTNPRERAPGHSPAPKSLPRRSRRAHRPIGPYLRGFRAQRPARCDPSPLPELVGPVVVAGRRPALDVGSKCPHSNPVGIAQGRMS
ncbi:MULTISPECIES: nucleotidyltransferase domain-containing protein [unclassified Bradyrhizobium]|uniref:nucleotidyltransferase domain-containing protein n=1 Tax=unclassified Bradyrhizobium TaxID=2631580 RepID=UPI0028988522|nr:MULTISPECIES: nucleotidyltransferase domain-containing protein [unclassified Bradyrhizobium]